jgi:hypothetical protein
MEAESFYTDRLTDTTKFIVASPNFVNAPNNRFHLRAAV